MTMDAKGELQIMVSSLRADLNIDFEQKDQKISERLKKSEVNFELCLD
jgi:hypothetical protein